MVEAGGAWTSVTPGSQQYWSQEFNNVMYGRWKKIDGGHGRAILGYFGKTPLPPDPEVVKIASDQLELPVFEGDPLEAAPKNIEPARAILEENNLPVNDKNIFLALSAMTPTKKVELNEGLRFLKGNGKIYIPLKKKEEPKKEVAPTVQTAVQQFVTGPITSKCTVEEDGKQRNFIITVEPLGHSETSATPMAAATNSALSHKFEHRNQYSFFATSFSL